MTALLALLEHFHPKVKGAVSGAGVGAGIIALLVALGVQLTDAEKVLIDNVCALIIAYLIPSPSDPPPAGVDGVAQAFEVTGSTVDVKTESSNGAAG